MSDKTPKRAGRPRKSEGPRLPHAEVDRLLVEGEEAMGSDGQPTRRFPSFRELGERFGVAHSLIAQYAKRHDCLARRQRLLASEPRASPARAPTTPRSPRTEPPERTPPPPPEAPRRRRGRPAKGEAPRLPYDEIDKLLVFGEVTMNPDGSTSTTYPSYRELARRYGVSVNVIGNYSQRHNCQRRREEAQARIAAQADEKLIARRATAIAVSKDDTIRMIDGYLREFDKALSEGRVRFDDPTNFNTMVRLKEFVLGGADSRRELHTAISLESLQARHARMLREMRAATAAEEGLVDVLPSRSVPAMEERHTHALPGRSVAGRRSVSGDEKPPRRGHSEAIQEMITLAGGEVEDTEEEP